MNFVKEEAIVRSDLLLSTIIILLRMNVRKDYTLAHCGYILVERTKTYLIKLKHTQKRNFATVVVSEILLLLIQSIVSRSQLKIFSLV